MSNEHQGHLWIYPAFVDDIYDIVKKRWKFVDVFGLSTSAGLRNVSHIKHYCWWVQDWA